MQGAALGPQHPPSHSGARLGGQVHAAAFESYSVQKSSEGLLQAKLRLCRGLERQLPYQVHGPVGTMNWKANNYDMNGEVGAQQVTTEEVIPTGGRAALGKEGTLDLPSAQRVNK